MTADSLLHAVVFMVAAIVFLVALMFALVLLAVLIFACLRLVGVSYDEIRRFFRVTKGGLQ